MSIPTLVKLVLSGIFAVNGIALALYPTLKGADAFFGLPVSPEYFRSEQARRQVRAFRLLTPLCIAVTIAGVWLLGTSAWAGVLIVLGILSVAIALAVGYDTTRRHRVIAPTRPAAASLEPRSRWLYVRPGLEAISLVMVLGSIAYLASLYAWASLGEATIASQRMLWPAQFLTVVQLEVFVLLLLLVMGVAQARTTLPAPPSERYLELRDRYMRLMADASYLIKLILIAGFAVEVPLCIWGATNDNATVMLVGILGPLIGGQAVLFSALLLYYWPKMKRVRSEMQEIAGPGSLERSADSDGWIAGFMYYSPENPSVWVESRMGYGYALNFARTEAWGLLAILLLPAIYLIVAKP
jgi:uncharacterized membrane protein